MGAGGTVYHTVMDKDVKPNNVEVYDWAKNISGNAMSDETYNNIVREAQSQGVPVQLALAVANQESRGIQDSVSPAGALGVMQLMPETAKNLGVDPYNEVENIHGGVKYLKQMLDKFNGDYELALAAYNAGPDAVTKHNGIPPYSETQNSVKSINEFLNSSPNFSGNFYEDDEEETIPSDFAEGRYWIRQNNGVSYEGAQPQTTDAMYALSKWFYEKTGKPLVVSAVTNGSHADGEHSHKNGWKFDIHDGGSGAEGTLFTDDFQKGYLLDEFVKYGQSLGLGMNVESLGTGNVHIDVAVDGTQWTGELAGHNFGGYKGLKSTNRSTVAAPTSTADDGDSLIDGIIKNLLTSESNATPTFDVTQDRKLEQAIFPMFVENAKNTLEGDDAAAFLNFLEQNKMLKDDGTFKNSKGNREKLRQEYAEEISEFGQAKVDERYNQFMQNQKSADEKIRSAFEKIVQQEENEGNPDATKHRAILQNGQVGAMEQFLKNAGINFDTPVETESEVVNSADGWQKFSPENQARLAQYLKEELESEGALDENLGIALDNGNQQAIGNALEIFREIQRNKPIQQILSADEESLSDDAKKFREKYLEMQDRIQRIENSRVNLEATMKNNESESEVVPYFEDKRQLELATKNLETARAELEKLTPPKNINRVSESEQLENEMQEHSRTINALKSRIDDMGEPTDEKSLRRRNKLIRELKSTLDKQDAAIERYDELNDAGKIWREDAALNTNSPNELLNLLQMGIAQTENKLARVNRANRKAVSTKDTMKLKRQLSMLHSVMGAQVNPTLTISQALDGIADAQKNLSELVQQISATEENFQNAINSNDMTTAANLQAQSQQLQQQA
ncbi:MAG: transglycosylase SLT domain-containing protein, partial [Selenomonadaceae bacterium]|nr:transglycosylase SLT domain-containing protein [Selenomonadaceae bacterium]